MNIGEWLKRHEMTKNKFLSLVKCSRQTLWKIEHGFPISMKLWEKIKEITKGQVNEIRISDKYRGNTRVKEKTLCKTACNQSNKEGRSDKIERMFGLSQ